MIDKNVLLYAGEVVFSSGMLIEKEYTRKKTYQPGIILVSSEIIG